MALLVIAVLLGLWLARGPQTAGPVPIAHLLRMTALQAGLSTLLSLAAGIAMAWALDRLRFFGRNATAALLSAAIVTPAIVVAVGVIGVWGRAGWINRALAPFGLGAPSPFGLGAILYAHAILNAPIVTAVLFSRLQALPQTRLRLGRSLRLSPLMRFATLDMPALLPALPGLGALIFLLCFTSFPVVLILGGGPANQSFETAIYGAVRLDFDLGTAVRLALVQLAVTGLVLVPATLLAPATATAGHPATERWPQPRGATLLAALVLLGLGAGLGLPLVSVMAGLAEPSALFAQPAFWRAAATSLWIGLSSAFVALALGLVLALARVAARRRPLSAALGLPAFVYLALPGVTLALGLFLLVRTLGLVPETAAPFVLVLANALLTLPFAISTLTPALAGVAGRYGRLSEMLALSSRQRFKSVELPLIGREIGLVLAMGFGFSLGDLSAISLFGTQDFSTLPWLMQRALGAYRTNDAAAIAALLLIVAIATFLLLPPLTQRLARAFAR